MSADMPAGRDDAAGEDEEPSPEVLIDALLETVQSLDARLQAVESAVSNEDPEVAFDQWQTWLVETYGLHDDLPDDWEQVPGIRQELEALWAMWCSSYKKNRQPARGAGGVRWHEALHSAVPRIQDYRSKAQRNMMRSS